jgi:hypothetical protein
VRLSLVAVLAGMLAVGAAVPADAAREPTRKEAKAIKKGFLKERTEGESKIEKIRVSTEKSKFASVTYEITIDEVSSARATARRAPETYSAPSPVILKKNKKGKWKTVPKAPAKVKKDLKEKPKSNIVISGDVSATLTRAANCTEGDGFYSASIYDPVGDVYLSIEFPSYTGPHTYPALGVHSVASLAVGNSGGTPQYETGQGNDAFSSSGELYVDAGRWGIIEASMAKQPDEGGTYPQSVFVSGYWDCA